MQSCYAWRQLMYHFPSIDFIMYKLLCDQWLLFHLLRLVNCYGVHLQVRVQFAALGAPLVGDSVYMAAAVARMNDPHIDPFLEGTVVEEDKVDMVNEQWRAQHGLEPECAFGLQASVVSWEGESRIFKAGRPWWRQWWVINLSITQRSTVCIFVFVCIFIWNNWWFYIDKGSWYTLANVSVTPSWA